MRKFSLLLAAIVAPVIANAALAPEPAVIRTDIHDIVPTLSLGAVHDNNFYRAPSGSEEDTLVFTVSPGVVVRVGDDEEYGELTAQVTGGFVAENSDDNFLDYKLGLNGRSLLKANLAMSGGVGVRQGYDARGTGDSRGCVIDCPSEPDKYRDVTANGAMALGQEGSRGRLVLSGNLLRHDYTNNEPRTDLLDYDRAGAGVKFLWQIGGRTDATAEVNVARVDYTAGNTADNTDVQYLLGVEWEVTGKTTGYAKAGMQEKDFKEDAREDVSDPSYMVGVKWTPSELDSLDLSLAQTYGESDVIGADARQTQTVSARYSRQIGDRVAPWASVSQSTTTYEGLVREDKGNDFGFGVDYKFRRWAVFGLSYNTHEDDSSDDSLDYDREVIAFKALLTL